MMEIHSFLLGFFLIFLIIANTIGQGINRIEKKKKNIKINFYLSFKKKKKKIFDFVFETNDRRICKLTILNLFIYIFIYIFFFFTT